MTAAPLLIVDLALISECSSGYSSSSHTYYASLSIKRKQDETRTMTEEELECEYCEEVFETAEELDAHVEQEHLDETSSY